MILSCEIWVPYLLGIITGNNWWYAIGSTCWVFWLGPGTPFTLIAITITITIKKIFIKIKNKNKGDNNELQ